MNEVIIKTDYIKLDQLLKHANVVTTGGDAKYLIKNESVEVNGEICIQRGKKIRNNDQVTVYLYDELNDETKVFELIIKSN